MPRPRFARLSSEKRERLLETAAREFAAYGFEGASLNQILERAEISKGAAYYYFDDKADLFATAVHYYLEQVLGDPRLAPESLTAVTFWEGVAAMYQRQAERFADAPWALGVLKATRSVPRELLTAAPLAASVARVYEWLASLVRRGQTLGVLRSDLPEALLVHLWMAVDDVGDQWLLEQREQLAKAEAERLGEQVLDALRRLMTPPEVWHAVLVEMEGNHEADASLPTLKVAQ